MAYGHVDAYLPPIASERNARMRARLRAAKGAPTTIHHHAYGEDCTEECEYVRPDGEEDDE